MYVDDIKLAGKKQNIDPMWKELARNPRNCFLEEAVEVSMDTREKIVKVHRTEEPIVYVPGGETN